MSMKTFVLYDHQAHLSDLDWYAIECEKSLDLERKKMGEGYRRAVLRVLVAEWVFGGWVKGLDLFGWLVRVAACWAHVSAITEAGTGNGGWEWWLVKFVGVFVWAALGCLA